MPKFSLKDVASKVTRPSRSSKDEGQPLVTSQSTNNVYGQNQNRKVSSSMHPTTIPRSASSSSSLGGYLDQQPMVKIRAGMPSPTAGRKVAAVLDIDFDLVPFQFYTRIGDRWKEAYLQTLGIGLVCLLCPFIILLLVSASNHSYKKSYKKKAQSEKDKKKASWVMAALLVLTLAKDLIAVALALQLHYRTDASSYIVGYSPIVYFWFLVLFAFPITLFYIAEVRYEFGFDSDKKKLLKSFAAIFSSPKTKQQEAQKLNNQDKVFKEKYKLLSGIQTSIDEFSFVLKSTSKHLFVSAVVLSVVTCLFHALIPLFLQLIEYNGQPEPVLVTYNTTNNNTALSHSNGTKSKEKDLNMFIVIGLSTFNSLIVSILAAPYFVYVMLWKLGMLYEWKRFNKNEQDSSDTLVNGGPQGIAMWWKIRQTLKHFSSSGKCLSALIGKMASMVTMVLIASLSIAIFLKVSSLKSEFNTHYLIPLVIDNLLLYFSLLIIGTLSIMIDNEKKLSGNIIELKQLNLSYELGQLMNLEQEAIENEPAVKVKVRVMRGCLMLLQELTSTMENLEKGHSSSMTLFCFAISTLMIIPSTIIAFRYLLAVGA